MKTVDIAPEFESVEAFVQYCLDDERDSFTPGDAQRIAQSIGSTIVAVTTELRSYGLRCVINPKRPESRGFSANDHDKYSEKNGFISGTGIGGTSRHMVSHWQPT